MAIDSPLQQAIVNYLKKQGVSQRKFADLTGLSVTTYGTYSRMTSAMGIDVLDKILTTYPGLKDEIIKYLGGNTDKNLTEVPENVKEKEKAAINAALIIHLTNENKNLWEVLKKERGGGKKGKTRISDN